MSYRYLAGPLLALLLPLTACGEAEEVFGGAARAAGCAAAERAVGPVKDRARSAVEDLGANPESAKRELAALRRVVDTAAGSLSGDAEAALRKASEALGTLTDQARTAASGAVDRQMVRDAQDDLGTAIDDFTNIC